MQTSMMIKHFFLLPSLLRLALASQHAFSVQDDVLAFPQYEVKFTDGYISKAQAQARLTTNDVPFPDTGSETFPGDSTLQVEQYRGVEHDEAPSRDKDNQSYKYEMMVRDGQRFLCSVPIVFKPEEPSPQNNTLTKADEEKELARANSRGWELLAPMQGNCVYFISGWWSYRFCYNQGVKQFHQLPPSRGVPVYPPMEDPNVIGFMLGTYDSRPNVDDDAKSTGETEWEGDGAVELSRGVKRREGAHGELVAKGEQRYLVQRLGGGTLCDLTGKDRRIEVQFHCNPATTDRITLIKEKSTCAYLMVIQTPRLCSDVAFLPPQKDQPNTISCAPIIEEDEVEWYETALKARNSALKSSNMWTSNADGAAAALGAPPFNALQSQTVGDLVIGAHTIVPEGETIEKSAIVGGGKETYIETIADSEGRLLSKEDMEKLGLGDAKAVEELRKKLKKIAGGKEWKLDVVDTPNGREYRGIIGEDDDGPDEDDVSPEDIQGKNEEEGKGEGSEEDYKDEL